MDKKKIKKSIEDFYQDVAQGEINVEGNIKEINQSLGYSQEDLEAIPEEAQLGLGCGNPVINARVQAEEIVADLGSGRGMDVFLMSKTVGEEGLVIGIDNNQTMIDGAKEIAKKRDYINVDFRLGEIDDLPIEDGSLDLLISNCAINLSTDKRKVYREIYRVLKTGGRISLSDIVLKKELPEEIKGNPRVHGTWVGGALVLDELEEIIKESGFKDMRLVLSEVSDEYAHKWGYGLMIKDYIGKADILAYK